MKRIARVCGLVDEALRGRCPPGTRFPDVSRLIHVDNRFAFRPLGVHDRTRRKGDPPGSVGRVRHRRAWREAQDRGARVGRVDDEEGDDSDFVNARHREFQEDFLRGRAACRGRVDLESVRVVHVEVEVVAAIGPFNPDRHATRMAIPEVRCDVDGEEEVVALDVSNIGIRRTELRNRRGLRKVGRSLPRRVRRGFRHDATRGVRGRGEAGHGRHD